jgi:hypothetical protein
VNRTLTRISDGVEAPHDGIDLLSGRHPTKLFDPVAGALDPVRRLRAGADIDLPTVRRIRRE